MGIGHRDRRTHDLQIARLALHVAHELAVDLQAVHRHLPESRRFELVTHASSPPARLAGHGRRFWLLALTLFLLALFATPASQLGNDFLKEARGFSGARIAVFTLVTATPAGIGIIVGGRLADTRGRRVVGAFGVAPSPNRR